MSAIHEVAILSAKGQLRLPKSVRQALDIHAGTKLVFSVQGNELVISRADSDYEDPAIAAFLNLLAMDIQKGRNIQTLPENLAHSMLEQAGFAVDLDEEIIGEVVI